MAGKPLTDNIQINAPKSIDNRYGKIIGGKTNPFASVEEAKTILVVDSRYLGMTFYAIDGGVTKEFWWRDDVNAEPVEKNITEPQKELLINKPSNNNMPGRVYLGKNLTGVTNILTQAMVSTSNIRYHFQYDYSLNGETVIMPANCVIKSDGGNLRNGTLQGNNTVIDAGMFTLFQSNLILTGTWIYDFAYVEWFGARTSGVSNTVNYAAIQKAVDTFTRVKLAAGTYAMSQGLLMNKPDVELFGANRHLSSLSVSSDTAVNDYIIRINNQRIKVNNMRLFLPPNITREKDAIYMSDDTNPISEIFIEKLFITNITGDGIGGTTRIGAGFGDVNIIDLNIILCKNKGLYLASGDSYVHDVRIGQCGKSAMIIEGGNTRISDIKAYFNGRNNGGTPQPAVVFRSPRAMINNLDVQENYGVGVHFADNAYDCVGTNLMIDNNSMLWMGNEPNMPPGANPGSGIYEGILIDAERLKLQGKGTSFRGPSQKWAYTIRADVQEASGIDFEEDLRFAPASPNRYKDKSGIYSITGIGQTTIAIPHGLIRTPPITNVIPKSAAARTAGVASWTENATNIVITLNTPNSGGTLSFFWEAKLK